MIIDHEEPTTDGEIKKRSQIRNMWVEIKGGTTGKTGVDLGGHFLPNLFMSEFIPKQKRHKNR